MICAERAELTSCTTFTFTVGGYLDEALLADAVIESSSVMRKLSFSIVVSLVTAIHKLIKFIISHHFFKKKTSFQLEA